MNPAVFKGKHQTKAVTHILQFWVLHLTPLSQLQAMSTANKDLRIFFKINLVKEQKYFSESISIGQTKILHNGNSWFSYKCCWTFKFSWINLCQLVSSYWCFRRACYFWTLVTIYFLWWWWIQHASRSETRSVWTISEYCRNILQNITHIPHVTTVF